MNRLAAELGRVAVIVALAALIVLALPNRAQTDRAGADPGGVTGLFIQYEVDSWLWGSYSNYGDYIGYMAPPDFSFDAYWDYNNGQITIRASGPNAQRFSLKFNAPPGQTLGVGTYEAAQGDRAYTAYFMIEQCSTSTSRFTITQLEMQGSTVTRFAATFEQQCDRQFPANFGTILFNATDVPMSALVMSPTAASFTPGSSASFSITNPGTVPQPISASIGGLDASDFTITANTCTTLEPGASCQIDVRFDPIGTSTGDQHIPPQLGKRRAGLHLTDATARGESWASLLATGVGRFGVSLSADANPVNVGTQVTLHVVTDASSGWVDLIEDQTVLATAPIVNGSATVSLSMSLGAHWITASIAQPDMGRSESSPLRIVVQP